MEIDINWFYRCRFNDNEKLANTPTPNTSFHHPWSTPKSNAIFVMKMFKRIKIAIAQGQGFLCTAVAFSRLHCKLADRRSRRGFWFLGLGGVGQRVRGSVRTRGLAWPGLSHAWPHGLVQEGLLERLDPSTGSGEEDSGNCTWALGKNANILLHFRPE